MSQGQSSEREELLKNLLSIFEGWGGESEPSLAVVVGIIKSFSKRPGFNVKQESVKVEPEVEAFVDPASTNSDNFDIVINDNEEEKEKEAANSSPEDDHEETILVNVSVEEPSKKKQKVSKKSKSKSQEIKPIPELLNDISDCMDSSSYKIEDKPLLSPWFKIWSLTDCSAKNCEVFYSSGGIGMVKKCGDLSLLNSELAEVMLGALGNVAEVDELRPKLMTSDLIKLLYKLMYPASQQKHLLKIRYGASSILMEILRDGPKAWKIEQLNRNVVLNEIRNQIEKNWDVTTDEIVKTFSYKSLKHLWRLFRVTHTVECHLFAAWTAANLALNIPDKYGLMLKQEEKGVGWRLLNEIRSSSQDRLVVKYAKKAIEETSEFYNSIK